MKKKTKASPLLAKMLSASVASVKTPQIADDIKLHQTGIIS